MFNQVCLTWCLSAVRPRTSAQRRRESAKGGLAVPRDSLCQAVGEPGPSTLLGTSAPAFGPGVSTEKDLAAVSGDSVSWGQQGPVWPSADTGWHQHPPQPLTGPADHVCSLLAHYIPAGMGSPQNFPSCHTTGHFHFHSASWTHFS